MGNTIPFSPDFLLPFWNHYFVIVRLMTALVDVPASSWIHHTWICVVYARAWPAKTSSQQLVYQTLLWWWQSFFILINLEYHINFAYTCVTETWLCIPYGALEGYHLACVQIIGIIQAHLNHNLFNSMHFLWHWIGIDTHRICPVSISLSICCYISVTVVFHEYGFNNGIVIVLMTCI